MRLSGVLGRWSTPLLGSLVVAALLLVPGDKLPDAGAWSWLDKPVHAVLFAAHCGLWWRALAAAQRPRRALVTAALLSGAYALALETLQIWVTGRGWSAWDLVAGWTGIAAVALVGAAGSRARLRGAR